MPIYCLSEVFKRNAAEVNTWEDPLSDLPSRSHNDPSRLPKSAYDPSHGHGGF
ncbi:hypothetical protein KSF_078770 [Reticulibacter mediterranei]|uniref:Uncharacterized protein n=1 Tax=Reticulibacter mediterranei TaxID=2778369 RepID=A0A8J3ILI9_9CHLR|nr:hypothetical protein KSF_078770 [Reticulibacter mediterranei]